MTKRALRFKFYIDYRIAERKERVKVGAIDKGFVLGGWENHIDEE